MNIPLILELALDIARSERRNAGASHTKSEPLEQIARHARDVARNLKDLHWAVFTGDPLAQRLASERLTRLWAQQQAIEGHYHRSATPPCATEAATPRDD